MNWGGVLIMRMKREGRQKKEGKEGQVVPLGCGTYDFFSTSLIAMYDLLIFQS
jgi:hypothetical protein